MFCFNKLVVFATITLIIALGIIATPVPVDDKNSNIDGKAVSPSPKCEAGAAAAAAVACFSSDTLVTLINQKRIPIGQLQSGDQLLTIDGTNIVNTEIMMMLDQNQLSSAMFHTIVTTSGHKVSLTGLHLLAIVSNDGEIKYKSAKDIKQGDILRVATNGEVYSSPVNNVTMDVKTGLYAPLTMAGTLLVNDVVASCFSNVKNHDMAHFNLNPLRWYYQLSRSLFISKPFGDKTVDGIHLVPQMLYGIVQLIYPSILRLN